MNEGRPPEFPSVHEPDIIAAAVKQGLSLIAEARAVGTSLEEPRRKKRFLLAVDQKLSDPVYPIKLTDFYGVFACLYEIDKDTVIPLMDMLEETWPRKK